MAGAVTARAVEWLRSFSEAPDSLIPVMAGRAEELVGSPEDVAAATWALIQEIVERIGRDPAR